MMDIPDYDFSIEDLGRATLDRLHGLFAEPEEDPSVRMDLVSLLHETEKAVLLHWEEPTGSKALAVDIWIPKSLIIKIVGNSVWVAGFKFKNKTPEELAIKVY